MKDSPSKRRWVYVTLILMLFALISFTALPLISSIAQESQSPSKTASAVTEDQTRLARAALGYQMVLEKEPNNENALRGLLDIELQQNDLAGAVPPLEKLALLHPQQPDYLLLLAQLKQQLQDYSGAATAYRTFLASHPYDLLALGGMVNILMMQNREQEAISLVQNALQEAAEVKDDSKDITGIQLLLGQIYATQEHYQEAIAVYDQAISDNNNDFRPLLAKALILQKQGEVNQAQSLFQKAVKIAPAPYKDQIKQMVEE